MSGFDDENPDNHSNESGNGIPDRLKKWFGDAKSRGVDFVGRFKGNNGRSQRFEFKKIELKKVSENSHRIRWALVVLALFILADITARLIGMNFRPAYTPLPKKMAQAPTRAVNPADYDSVLRRNMFNVEQKIPAPFDQGQLDCLSQARPSTQRLILLGTIVMNDENHSVALLQQEGNPNKLAVKKDEFFIDGQFVAKKVERRKFCFQVKSSGDFEFVEIPDDSGALGVSANLTGSNPNIIPTSEGNYDVNSTYLKGSLQNLNQIVQTARATGYTDPTTGKFAGFLIQSIDADSPFAALGVQRGDILTFVNNIVFDNMGRGIEALNQLKEAPKISLGVIRNGEKKVLNYTVK